MNEFGFRAWHKKNKKWVKDFYITNDGFVTTDGDENMFGGHHDVMQYTGLKDRSGNGIYEGDYILLLEEDTYLQRVTWNDEWARFQLEWWGGDNEWEISDDSFDWLETRDMEIIGNIYDNPELLKEVPHE